jgi:ribulose-phosphate 3-epimerase
VACANPLAYGDDVLALAEAGIDALHLDICDGHFAPTFLLAPSQIRAMRPLAGCRFDAHLYCTHPSRYLDELAAAGADLIVVHLEASEPAAEVVAQIRARGLRAGVALLPSTPAPADVAALLPALELVVVNMVGPAYAGQPFDARGLENAAAIAHMARRTGVEIEIAADGHVSVDWLPRLLAAGCTHLVCGTSSIFRPPLPLGEALHTFRAQVERAARLAVPVRLAHVRAG